MTIKYSGKVYATDNDFNVVALGFWPSINIKNKKLKDFFKKEFGRTFLGGSELVAYAQSLVSRGMDFDGLEKDILEDAENPDKKHLRDIVFGKTSTGIGRGHSLGGLAGVVLGMHGTKMIDSGLTGLCSSRSLVTSSRRRETGLGDIIIPENLQKHPELLKEYMRVSEEVLDLAKDFKEKFGKTGGIETFNKVIPYNNPADLFIVLPLDTLSTIVSEVRQDELELKGGRFIPKELHTLAKEYFDRITKEIGQDIMFKQRIEVPRDTYLHYTVFKNPNYPNSALEEGELRGMPIEPIIVDFYKNLTPGFRKALNSLEYVINLAKEETNPEKLLELSMRVMYELRRFSNEQNENIRVKIADSLSWRVWSEQKRHATLRQNVESVYSAAPRASGNIMKFWSIIQEAYKKQDLESANKIIGEVEKNIIIDDRLKRKKELILPYLYHTAKQLVLYNKFKKNHIDDRDSLYIVPKNIRVRTLENYDLVNLINLELPLRLCGTCEPERQATSWKKREKILEVVPELKEFLQPKCNTGYCTEGKPCAYMEDIREYNMDLHKAVKEVMLEKAKQKLL